jgi:acetyl-CoA carboxylase biotin carboxylase subunit
MFQKLLIANRGEIARRINRVARELGLSTVAVYSEADAGLPFVKEADESVCIGPAAAKDSYLSTGAILEAAKKTGAQAIHPGYGFLSESADFAQACAASGVTFVGPTPEAMARMKDKSRARQLVSQAGVPVVPGSDAIVPTWEAAAELASKLGYPVLCKAAGGGGGIGMAPAKSPEELEKVFRQCADRAKAAFGREGLYLERYFEMPRHIEVQILGDTHDNLIHCFERECSIQRRHQKVVEEAPSPLFADRAMEPLRERLYEAALGAARAFGYSNAGTVEFLYENGAFYFIEMNARLQVEHPITELITGLNLIAWQLKIAAGERLSIQPSALTRRGAAMEFRIYAEDPVRFLPSPGTLKKWREPSGEGVRVDAGYTEGCAVTPYYDPMLAKLIVWGNSRDEVIGRAERALASFEVEGIKTNIPLHQRILKSAAFREGALSTRFLQQHAQPNP